MVQSAFPSDFESPKVKEGNAYGLKLAKAISSNNETSGPTLFYNDREAYVKYLKYFRGEQDDVTKPALGINPRDAKSTWVHGIRWQIKNYCTKRVNIAVSKIANRKYDPVAEAIDPLSIDRKADYKARVKAFMEDQEFLLEMQSLTNTNMLPEGMTLEEIPINDEDLKIHIDNNHKYLDEMDLELGVSYHLKKNDFDQVKEMYDFDLFVLGVGGAIVDMDSNAMPEIKWLDPSRVVVPKTDLPNFKRAKYRGFYDEYTVSEFRKLHGGEIEPELEKQLVDQHAFKGGGYDYADNVESRERDVDKIKVMHFEYETIDEHVLLEKEDRMGNKRLHVKDYDYYKTASEQQKFRERYKGERKLIRKPYTCFYTGYWIVGSDVVFKYGKKKNNTGKSSYKLFAPNLRDNRTVSTLKQMIPCLDNLETYDKKIQHIVASAIPKGVQIDLDALQNASFEFNGKDMTVQDLLQMYFQRGILISSSGERYGNGNGYKPITEMENGMANDVVHYINLINKELNDLDEIIGINKVTAASSLPKETGKAVAQLQEGQTEVALDYLYRADQHITQDIYSEVGDLHIQSVKYNDPEVYEGIFGKTAVQRMKQAFSRYSYGIEVEAQPTAQEWQEFYMDLKGYITAGLLQPEDGIMIRRSNNLKQAQAYMRVTMKKRRKEAQDSKMADIKANMDGQAQSNQAAHSNLMQIETTKGQFEMQKIGEMRKTEAMKHKWKMEELTLQSELEGRNKLREIDKQGDEKLDQIALDKELGYRSDSKLADKKVDKVRP